MTIRSGHRFSRFPGHWGLILIALAAFASSTYGIDFDSTFASGGKFLTSFATTGQPSASGSRVYIQPSGRVVVVGRHQQQGADGRTNGIAIVGLTSAGVLDNGFGSAGKVLLWSASAQQQLIDTAILPDGSLLIFSQFLQAPLTNRPVLVKYTPDGQIDGAFTADIEIVANQTLPVILTAASDSKIYTLVRQNSQYSLIRLNSTGTRDTTFGPDGVRSVNLNRFPSPSIFGMREMENGKLILTGDYYNTSFERVSFVVRFDSGTNIDRSFGMQGATRVAIAYGSVDGTRTLLQSDGKVLFGGFYTFLGSDAVLVRLTTRGRLDTGFGDGGIVATSFNNVNAIYGIAVAPDGKMIVTGVTSAKAVPPNQRLFVARFSSTGVRESFLVTNFIIGRDAGGADVSLQADGKMVATGFTANAPDNFSQLVVARFTP